ncbi:MAG: MarR family transcriptional regulator [Ignavibacteriae bacterium]|nr:MarR family transcriptional regulator [Ignavibacteriota bacterium]
MTDGIFNIITNLKNRCLDKEESIQKEYMLSPAEYNALLALAPVDTFNCNELSKKMNLSVSRSSRILDKLIKNGYLKEIKNKEDRRVLNVKLTDKGTDIRNKIRNKLDECEKDILSKLQKSELYLLEDTLNKISSVFISN